MCLHDLWCGSMKSDIIKDRKTWEFIQAIHFLVYFGFSLNMSVKELTLTKGAKDEQINRFVVFNNNFHC